jgi:hypothetical protein
MLKSLVKVARLGKMKLPPILGQLAKLRIGMENDDK